MAISNGSTVWLKSGSPQMTVKFKNSKEEYTCTWFIGSEVKEHSFSPEQLTEEKPKSSSIITGGKTKSKNSW